LRKIFGKERIISVKKLGYRFTTEWKKDSLGLFDTI
jgi:hypothetical protein